MKNSILIILLCFPFLTIGSQQFNLNVSKSFAPEEEVSVHLYNYYYYHKKDHFKEIYFTLYKVTKPDKFFINSAGSSYQTGFTDSLVSKLPIIKSWSEKVNKNYNQGVKIGQLEAGVYILEGIAEGQVAQVPIFVTPLSLITKNVGDELVAFVSNRKTGKATNDFESYALFGNKTIEPTSYKNCIAYFELSKDQRNRYLPIVAIQGQNVAISNSYYYNYYNNQSDNKSYIFTDRSGYRPKQTVYFKGIIRKKDKLNFILPDEDSVTYLITDQQQKEIAKRKVKLDKNGSFSDSLFIEENFGLGTYHIDAYFDNQSRRYWWYGNDERCSFRVEEYKKPEFEVKVKLDKSQYVMGDEIKANVNAHYFFGAPVANASVTYKILREEYYVPYYWYYPYSWWYEDYYSYTYRPEVIKTATANISSDGKLEFTLPTEGKDGKNYKYTVIAEVTDASRRMISGSKTVIVANTEFTLSAVSEKYYYKPGEEIKILASAMNYSKQAVATKITAYLTDSYQNFEKEKDQLQKHVVQTDPNAGEAAIKFKVDKAGYYTVVLEAEDSRGKTVRKQTYCYVFNPEDNYYDWWQSQSSEIRLFSDKKVYNSGEKVNVMAYIPHEADAMIVLNNESFLHYNTYNFIPKNKAQKSQGSFKELIFDLPSESFGNIEIQIAYMHDNKFYNKSEHFTIIPNTKYLDVNLVFNKNEYRPGTEATATLKVTDHNGKPVPNALVTLSTADESIYSLYPDKSGDIRKVFYDSKKQNYNINQNTFNKNDYSKHLNPYGIIWRKKKLDVHWTRNTYLEKKQWYRAFNDNTRNKELLLTGFVVDYHTGLPINKAKIKLGDKKAVSNKNGFYRIKGINPKDSLVAEFSFNGKKTIINLSFQANTNIYLNTAISNHKDKEITLKEFRSTNGRLVEIMDSEDVDEEIEVEELEEVAFSQNDNLGAALTGAANGNVAMDMAPSLSKSKSMWKKDSKSLRRFTEKNRKKEEFKEATIRSEFKDAIYWNPNIVTDPNGEATIKIKLPDNLTTWRSSAKVITNDSKVGQTFVKTVVTKNLLVRMETPRFITVGDEMLIATNIHNYLSESKKVKVALAANGLEVAGTEKIIEVSANGEERVDWKINAKWALESKLTVKALTNEESDAKEVKVPVLPHGLEIIKPYAAYVHNETSKEVNIDIPKSTDLNTAKLEVSVAPSITSALLGAMDDLIGYPYGCVEQTMSRFLPNVIVANTLKEIGNSYSSTVNRDELKKMVAQGLKRLKELQHSDGGWGWWENDATHPFMTAYVCNGLFQARKAGYEIPDDMYDRGMNSLFSQIKNKKEDNSTTHAYQMMVAMQVKKNKDIWEKNKRPGEKSNAYEQALWLQAAHYAQDKDFQKRMLDKLNKSVIKESSWVFWGAKKFYYSWKDDQVETTAHVVKALSLVDDNNPLLPKAIQWLMMKRKGNSWHNTRQTAITIMSLSEIIKSELNPNAEIEIFVNNTLIEKVKYTKENVGKKALSFSLKSESLLASASPTITGKYNLLKSGKNTIKIVQTGKGRSYLNAKLVYFLDGKENVDEIRKKSMFQVERNYYKLEKQFSKEGKLTYKKIKISAENIKSGDEILVKVKVNTKSRQEYVLIEDPIPAGCEFIRKTAAFIIDGEGKLYDEDNNRSWWNYWYTHREYRDSKMAMTITYLNTGGYEYSYLLKAQIPGEFKVTPAVAQLMYYPEHRGFSKFETIKIKE